jgi:hypothetical protein
VLSQGPLGKDLTVAYASRSLNKEEINYTTSEQELLAIVCATRNSRPYLHGRHFKIVNGHKALPRMMNVEDRGLRLLGWRIQLDECDYEKPSILQMTKVLIMLAKCSKTHENC